MKFWLQTVIDSDDNNLITIYLVHVYLQEVSLSGWQIIRKAGEQETPFKFHRSMKIDGNAHVTVWSLDSGITHEPPHTIVMVGMQVYLLWLRPLNRRLNTNLLHFKFSHCFELAETTKMVRSRQHENFTIEQRW